MDIVTGVVVFGLIAWMIVVPIAGAMAGLEERQKREPSRPRCSFCGCPKRNGYCMSCDLRKAFPEKPVLDRDARLDWSEKAPVAAVDALMAELAREGARQLLEERSW